MWILTGPRLQGQDQDQGADHQVQAVEGPFPVSVFLVGVHQGDGEEQQELHRQLSGLRMQDGVSRETRVWAGRPWAVSQERGCGCWSQAKSLGSHGPPKASPHTGAPHTTPTCSLLALQNGRSKIMVSAGPCAFWKLGKRICFLGCPSSEGLPASLGSTSPWAVLLCPHL